MIDLMIFFAVLTAVVVPLILFFRWLERRDTDGGWLVYQDETVDYPKLYIEVDATNHIYWTGERWRAGVYDFETAEKLAKENDGKVERAVDSVPR